MKRFLTLAVAVALALVVALLALRGVEPADLARPPIAGDAEPAGPSDGARARLGAAERDEVERRPAALAAAAPPRGSGPLERGATLSGVVLDERDAPCAGAEVDLVLRPAAGLTMLLDDDYRSESERIATSRSDEQGRFAFEVERSRSYDLVARTPRHATSRVEGVGAGRPVVVRLARGATLVVRATRERDGAPVAGARVLWMHGGSEDEREARTDGGGLARLEGLAPGGAYAQVVPELEVSVLREVELVAGETLALDVALADGHAVEGVVRQLGSGRPIAGAEVSSWDFRGKTVRTDAFGRYRIDGVRAGVSDSVTICARAPGHSRADRRVALASGAAAPCDLELAPGFAVRGRVVAADGKPIAGAYVAAIARGADGAHDLVSSRSGPGGRFELADASRDYDHALLVRSRGSATATRDLPAPADGEAVVEVGDIVLAPGAAVVGRARGSDGEPLVEKGLTLRHLDAAPLAAAHALATVDAWTDGDGRFRFADLAPGRYEVVLWPMVPPGARAELALAAGEVREVELVTGGGGTIEGLVADAAGLPVEGAEVHVTGPEDPRWIGRATTGADGRFRIESLPDLELEVGAERHDPIERDDGELLWKLGAPPLRVRPGSRDLVLVLRDAQTIEGRVLGVDGLAPAGAGVEAFDDGGQTIAASHVNDGRFRLRVPQGAVVRLVGFRQRLEKGRFVRVPTPGERAVVERVEAGARDVVVRFEKVP